MTELSKVSVTALKGVGEAMAEKLAKVGLENVQDVLFHLPLRYQDRTRVVPIGALRPGQDAVVEGRVIGADVVNETGFTGKGVKVAVLDNQIVSDYPALAGADAALPAWEASAVGGPAP